MAATDSKYPGGKPFTPSLSSKFRGTKSPLTPRLAGSAPHSPASAPRRDAVMRGAPPPRTKEVTAAPVTATTPPLNGNITPRSGARRSRIGSESPATPTSATRAQRKSPPKPIAPAAGLGISNLSVSSPKGHTNHMANPVRPPRPTRTIPKRLSGPMSHAQNDESIGSKFIRAEAARSSARTLGSGDKIPISVNDGKFFTAGTPQSQSITPPKPSLTKPTPNSRDNKFFHASDIRTQSSPRSSTDPEGVHDRGPGASPILSRLQSVGKSQPVLSAARTTVSPKKPTHELLKTTPNPAPTIPHPSLSTPLAQSSIATSLNPTRRPSISSNVSNHKPGPILGHSKALSTSSLTVTSNRRASISRGDQPVSAGPESPEKPPFISLSPNTVSSRSASLASSSFATSIASEIDRPEAHKLSGSTIPDGAIASILAPPFEPSTPASSEPPNVQNDVAATARRERKVLDLEISNSSLLAINKTLERELRKQTVELRRFRRLTRSGRLAITPADRTVSNSTLDTVPELFDEDHSDSEQDGDDASGLDEDDNLSSNSSDPLSPTFKASQRTRDEKRLLLNLSKHQQLLVDSQKLTLSIRRCLTCTEELIRDANKAIDYRVGIGDIKLGGRVLSTDELESQSAEADQEEYCSCLHNRGLLGPGVDTTTKTELMKTNLQTQNPTTTDTAEPLRDEEDKILTVAVERLFQDLLHGP
ncbi:hypothetical protein DV736_g1105, partial [Chaetothyriales sp. CBS 134916]